MSETKSIESETPAAVAGAARGSAAGYRVFHGQYHISGSYGWWRDLDVVVVAENESQAHTWAVMQYTDTIPNGWSFTEIDINKPGCTYIYERES